MAGQESGWLQTVLAQSQQDPNIWIKEILGERLWSKQREICESIVTHERTAVPASFGCGKTFLAARIALWFLYNHPNSKVISTAPCFDDQTEILTEDGWKLFKDLNRGEKVASRVDGKLEFVYPSDYMDYDVYGEMIGYKSGAVDFLVTPHHKLLMKKLGKGKDYDLVKAEDAYEKWDWKFNKEVVWEGEDDPYGFTADDYEFFGFWFGDGSARYSEEGRNYAITITQSKYADTVRGYLQKSGYKFSEYHRGTGSKNLEAYNFTIYNKDLAGFFIEQFGRLKQSRRIPNWIKNAQPEKLEAFVKGFLLADGNISESKGVSTRARIYGNKGLSDDLQEVGFRAGYVVSMKEYVKSDEEMARRFSINGGTPAKNNIRDWVSLTFNKGAKNTRKFPKSNRKNWYKADYVGHVYCVTVPSHVVLVRRGGVYHWSGQTTRQVRDLLWSEIRTAHAKSKFPLGGNALQLRLELNHDHFALGFSTDDKNMDMFTGYHSPYQLVIFDQAAGISPGIWDGAEGLMTSSHCRWLAISNTAISDCEFANICMPEKQTRHGDWNIIKISAEESPNVVAGKDLFPGLISHDWVERKKRDWAEDDPLYKIFVKAEFVPSAQMVVIPYKYLVDTYTYEGSRSETIDVGIDVAREGIDSTVFVARSGEAALKMKRLTGNDTMEVAGEAIVFVREVEKEFGLPVVQIKVDTIGVGAGVYDRLAEQDFPVVAINNQSVEPVVDKETFSNIRAEMAWSFRKKCESNSIGLANLSKDSALFDYLKKDIQSQRYKITSAGRIQILPKESMKELLGRSPDYWDATVMAFEDPGGGPATVESLSGGVPKEEPSSGISDEEWLEVLGASIDIEHESFA